MNVALTLRQSGNIILLSSLGVCLLVVAMFSLTIGAVSIPLGDVFIFLAQKLGLFSAVQIDPMHETVLDMIRLPRIVMTLLIGAALGTSGAALQGLFRNPLVEPGLIGISGGAAATVVFVTVFGSAVMQYAGELFSGSLISFAAFAGGLAATFLVLKLSIQEGRTNIAVLILIGVAINALTGALIGLAIFYADEKQLNTFIFWTLGDLGGATWNRLAVASPVLLLSMVVLLPMAPALNAMALGESEAFHLGVDVERTKKLTTICCALGVGVSVSLAGIIGFVGLVVPHIIRVSFRPDNTTVLPASFLGGAILLLAADIIARTVVSPAELPIGVVTALIGSPFFIALLIKAKRKREL